MKKILVIGVPVTIVTLGVLFLVLKEDSNDISGQEIVTSEPIQSQTTKKKTTNSSARLKERLEKIKAKAAAFKKSQSLVTTSTEKAPVFQPDRMERSIEAGKKLDNLLSKGRADKQAASTLSEKTSAMLTEHNYDAVKVAESACTKPICRVTLSVVQPDQMGKFFQSLESKPWPWQGHSKLLITKNPEPIKMSDNPKIGQPMKMEIKVYFSNTDKDLPIDKKLQSTVDATHPGPASDGANLPK